MTNVVFYSHAAAGNLRLGIYDNGSPKHLLWQSGAISNTAAGAWLAVPIAAGTPGGLSLAPGTYWLAWQVDTTYDVPSYVAGGSGDGFFLSQNFGGFPGTTLAGGQSTSETWSMYFNYTPPVPPRFTGMAFQPDRRFQLATGRQHQHPVCLAGLHQPGRLAAARCLRLLEQRLVVLPRHKHGRVSATLLSRRGSLVSPAYLLRSLTPPARNGNFP